MGRVTNLLCILQMIFVFVSFSTSCAEEHVLPSADSSGGYDHTLNEYYVERKYYTFLCDDKTFHFLQNIESSGTSVDALTTFSATCYSIDENGDIAVCIGNCGELFSQIPPFTYSGSFGRPFFIIRSSQNHTYLLNMNGEVYQWQPEGDNIWNCITTLDFQGIDTSLTFDADWQDFISFAYAIWEDTLYASYKNAGDGYTIYAFDLENGNRRKVCYVGQIYSLSAGDGKLLACASEKTTGALWYYLIDCATGEKTKFVMGLKDQQSSELIYDGQGGWYYASRSGTIRRLAADGIESIVASFPMLADGSSCDLTLSADRSKLLLLEKSYSGATVFRTIELESRAIASLVFDGWTNAMNSGFGTLPSFSTFAMEHEQVQSVMRSGLSTGHDVAQALLTKNDAFDILVMNTAVMDLQSLYSKGFFVNLADDDVISAYFDQLYPTWRDACMWRGQIAAFPLQADDRYQFMYNAELWLDLGLTIPQTYAQLFQCIQQWSDEGILDEYPLFEINGNSNRSYEHLFNKLLGDYILRCEAGEQPLDFQDPALLELLRQLEEMRNLLDKHDSLNLTGTPLMAFRGGVTAVNFDHSYESYGHYDPLMLGFTEEDDPIMQASMIVMVLNPHGKNIELAKDYLSYLAGNPTPVTQCVFLQGMPDGIATIQSQAAKAEWEAEYASCEQQLQVAQASGDADAISTAKKTQEVMLLREPETVWAITPEHARILYHALPYAQVVQYYPYTTVLENGEQILERYLAGQIGAEELMRNLRALVMMIEAE